MDKLHYYVCQTDVNLSKYIERAETDAKLPRDDRTLTLMNACSKNVESESDEDEGDDGEGDERGRDVEVLEGTRHAVLAADGLEIVIIGYPDAATRQRRGAAILGSLLDHQDRQPFVGGKHGRRHGASAAHHRPTGHPGHNQSFLTTTITT